MKTTDRPSTNSVILSINFLIKRFPPFTCVLMTLIFLRLGWEKKKDLVLIIGCDYNLTIVGLLLGSL